MTPRVLIIGLGQSARGDDAAGLLAAELLAQRLPSHGVPAESGAIRVLTRAESAWDALLESPGPAQMIIIDAALAGSDWPAGSWRCLRYPADMDVLVRERLGDTHTIDLHSLLRTAQVLGRLPPDVRIYAIAATRFELGAPIDGTVRAAVRSVVDQIEWDLFERLEARPCTNSQ